MGAYHGWGIKAATRLSSQETSATAAASGRRVVMVLDTRRDVGKHAPLRATGARRRELRATA